MTKVLSFRISTSVKRSPITSPLGSVGLNPRTFRQPQLYLLRLRFSTPEFIPKSASFASHLTCCTPDMALSGSTFCCNVNQMDIRRFSSKPSFAVDNLTKLDCFSPVQTTKCSPVLSTKAHSFPDCRRSKHRCGRPPTLQPVSYGSSSLRAKNEDVEGTLSGEGVIVVEQNLMRDLQIAIQKEDYMRAAEIRDSLRVLHEDSQASVLAANARFYESFKEGNLAAMQTLWSKGDTVCCVHPGSSGIFGYDHVMESWEVVWMNYEFPLEIEVKDVRVHVRGDVGYVSCMEFVKSKGGRWGGQFVTNVFEKVDGQWFICVHHASPVDL